MLEDPPAPPETRRKLLRTTLGVAVPVALAWWLLHVFGAYTRWHSGILTIADLGDGVVPALASATIVFLAACALGAAIVGRLSPALEEGAPRLLMSAALGTGALGTGIFLFSFVGWINHATVGALLLFSFIVGGRPLGRDVAAVVRALREAPLAPLLLLALLEALLLISALCPANRWDEISYHIPIALRGAVTGRYPILGDDFSYFPHLMSCLSTATILFGGGFIASRVLHYFFGIALLGAVHQTTSTLLPGRRWAPWLGVAIAVVEPTYISLSRGAGVDLVLAFYALTAMLHLVRDPSARGVFVAGLLGGFGCGATYRGAPAALSLAVATVVLGRYRQLPRLAVGGILAASPWYIRNAVLTGNPVFPFAAKLFAHRAVPTGFTSLGWATPEVHNRMLGSDAFGFALQSVGPGGAVSPAWTAPFRLPWEATIEGVASTGGRFDTDISPLYLVLAPLLLLATRAVFRRDVLAFFAFAAAHTVVWTMGVQCTRYQLSVMVVFAALFPVVASGLRVGVRGVLGVTWVGVAALYVSGLIHLSYRNDARYVFGTITENEYLAGHEDGAFFVQVSAVNAEPDTRGPVLLIGDNRTLYLTRPSLPDFVTDNIGVVMRNSDGTPEGIYALLTRSGIEHILQHRVQATFGLLTAREVAVWDEFLARYTVTRAEKAYASWHQLRKMAASPSPSPPSLDRLP